MGKYLQKQTGGSLSWLYDTYVYSCINITSLLNTAWLIPLTPQRKYIRRQRPPPILRPGRRRRPAAGRPRPLPPPRVPSRTETTISSRSAALETISPLRPGAAAAAVGPGSTAASEVRRNGSPAGPPVLPPLAVLLPPRSLKRQPLARRRTSA